MGAHEVSAFFQAMPVAVATITAAALLLAFFLCRRWQGTWVALVVAPLGPAVAAYFALRCAIGADGFFSAAWACCIGVALLCMTGPTVLMLDTNRGRVPKWVAVAAVAASATIGAYTSTTSIDRDQTCMVSQEDFFYTNQFRPLGTEIRCVAPDSSSGYHHEITANGRIVWLHPADDFDLRGFGPPSDGPRCPAPYTTAACAGAGVIVFGNEGIRASDLELVPTRVAPYTKTLGVPREWSVLAIAGTSVGATLVASSKTARRQREDDVTSPGGPYRASTYLVGPPPQSLFPPDACRAFGATLALMTAAPATVALATRLLT